MSKPPHPSEATFDVIVIGAGPAGLALGRECQRLGLSHCLLERGETAGESWRRMPSNLHLVSPWKASALRGPRLRRWAGHRQVSRADYLTYLQDYARASAISLRTHTSVHAVRRRSPRGFVVETNRGILTSQLVVNATGYFQNPFRPEIPGAAQSSVPQWHVAEVSTPEFLTQRLGRQDATILVVGKRLSAGQALVDLNAAGFNVTLSHRSPIQFGSGPIGWWIFFRIHPWIEAFRLRRLGSAARGFDVRMPGGRARELIERGMVRLVPNVAAFKPDRVLLANGESLAPDAVLYATGYRPVLAHLSPLGLSPHATTGAPQTNAFQSIEQPGLYFLGLDHMRNFQSRFLRGIRNDAELLAAELAEALGPPRPRAA